MGPTPSRPSSMSWARCLQGIDDVYLNTADPRYYNYIKSAVDQLVTADGAIPTYKPEAE